MMHTTSGHSHNTNLACFIHLSTFSKYLVPFGNFILPIVLWMSKRKEDFFVDSHGKQAVNFQLSMFIYKTSLILLALPFIGWQLFSFVSLSGGIYWEDHEGLNTLTQASGLLLILLFLGTLYLILFAIELVTVITAATRAHKGEPYNYPMSISFLRETHVKSNN